MQPPNGTGITNVNFELRRRPWYSWKRLMEPLVEHPERQWVSSKVLANLTRLHVLRCCQHSIPIRAVKVAVSLMNPKRSSQQSKMQTSEGGRCERHVGCARSAGFQQKIPGSNNTVRHKLRLTLIVPLFFPTGSSISTPTRGLHRHVRDMVMSEKLSVEKSTSAR
jgi:hypothetical protein